MIFWIDAESGEPGWATPSFSLTLKEVWWSESARCQRCGLAWADDQARSDQWAANGWLWRCPDCATISQDRGAA